MLSQSKPAFASDFDLLRDVLFLLWCCWSAGELAVVVSAKDSAVVLFVCPFGFVGHSDDVVNG